MASRTHKAEDTIKYWHEPVLGGIDLLSAHCVTHRFSRHAHEEFVLAVFERGAEQFEAEGRCIIAAEGSILLIPPGVAHTGQSATPGGWSYRAFYPRLEMLQGIAEDSHSSRALLSAMPLQLIQNRPLFNHLRQAHQHLSAQEAGLDDAVTLVNALSDVLAQALSSSSPNRPRNANRTVAIAKDYIQSHYAEPIDGGEIASVVGLSLPHLMRTFSARTGVPINVYLTSVRLQHARRLLLAGQSAAQAALEVGFVDQSHLIRRFREAFGVTPGQYLRESRRNGSSSTAKQWCD